MAPWGLTFLSSSEKMFTLVESYSFDSLPFWLVLQSLLWARSKIPFNWRCAVHLSKHLMAALDVTTGDTDHQQLWLYLYKPWQDEVHVVLFLLPGSYHVQRTSTTRRRYAFPGVYIVSQYRLVPHGTSSPRWPLIIEADVFTGFHNWWSTIRVTLDEQQPIWRIGATNPIFSISVRRSLLRFCSTKSYLLRMLLLQYWLHLTRAPFLSSLQPAFLWFDGTRIAPQEHTLVGRSFTEGLLSLAYLCQRSSAMWGSLAVLQDSGSWVTCRGNCNLPLYVVLLSLIPCMCCIAYRKWN